MELKENWTAPVAPGNSPSDKVESHSRIITPNSLEAQALKAMEKLQNEQDKAAMSNIAKAFTKEEWHSVLKVAPAQVLADELADRATKGEKIAKRMTEVYEEESKKWN